MKTLREIMISEEIDIKSPTTSSDDFYDELYDVRDSKLFLLIYNQNGYIVVHKKTKEYFCRYEEIKSIRVFNDLVVVLIYDSCDIIKIKANSIKVLNGDSIYF